jgi:hypothetical protein
MPAFDEKFSDEQRDAAAHARVELGMTYRRIVELAADGQLEHRGRKVDPFKISPEYVKDLANKLVRQRAGKAPSKLADRPHHDAVEILRRRTVACADALLEEYEKTLRKRPQEAEAAQDVPTPTTHDRDMGAERSTAPFERAETERDASPGSLVSERIAELQQ